MNTTVMCRRMIFAQVLLGIVASCLAERNPGLLLVAGAIGAMSWYVTEGPHGKTIPRWMVNAGALLAVAWLTMELVGRQTYVVAAMGHFTMVLQLLMLYTHKSDREYSQLLVLSLLQMIGASVLSVSMIYGAFLALYCVVALITLLLFHLTTAADQVHEANLRAAGEGARPVRPNTTASAGARRQLRWTAVAAGVLCGGIAATVFVTMPRTGKSGLDFGSAHVRTANQTGFSNTIRLGTGPIGTGSREPMLNIKIKSHGDPIGQEDLPWLVRGAALDSYNTENHTWFRSNFAITSDRIVAVPKLNAAAADAAGRRGPYYEAEVALRDARQRTIFSVVPTPFRRGAPGFHLARFESDNLYDVSFSPLDQQLRATESIVGASVYRLSWPIAPPRYDPTQTAPEDVPYAELMPRDSDRKRADRGSGRSRPPFRREREQDPPVTGETYARVWEIETQRVRAYALEVIREAGLDRDPEALHTPDDLKIAATLGDHLRTRYAYDLQNPTPPDGQDPVIAFLFERRRGHCELFASGLAVMCRSVGIPARVITGFRAGEFNTLGGYYVVRQSNAHAWTEVDGGPGTGWHTFDATPPEQVIAEHRVDGGLLATVRAAYEHVEFAWIRMVVAFDQRTQTAVLAHVRKGLNTAKRAGVTAFASTRNRLTQLTSRARLNHFEAAGMALSGVGLAVAATILIRLFVNRRRRLTRLQLAALPPEQRRGLSRQLGFYLGMLDILERHGHRRPAWQSPQRFATELVNAQPRRFASVLPLTEIFYGIRFGHREIDPPTRQRVRVLLRQLEQAVAQKNM